MRDAIDAFAERQATSDLLADLTASEHDRLCDMLRVIAVARLPDSRTRAADTIRDILWGAATRQAGEAQYRRQMLEFHYETRCES